MARRRAVPLPSIDDLFTSQEERDSAAAGSVEPIPLGLIDPFPNHVSATVKTTILTIAH